MKYTNIIDRVTKVLADNDIVADVCQHGTFPIIDVEVLWGDWKHEHLRTINLIKELGYSYYTSNTIEEDGSDCYSAIHQFLIGA